MKTFVFLFSRHYVHCINEWVSAAPSKIRIQCLDHLDLNQVPGVVPKGQKFSERIEQLQNQQDLDIDPRSLS